MVVAVDVDVGEDEDVDGAVESEDGAKPRLLCAPLNRLRADISILY